MSGPAGDEGARERILGVPIPWLIALLLALRVVVVILLVAGSDDVRDEGILRFERVATSPVTPYRNFAVEWMPLQTGAVVLLGGHGAAATAARVAVVAFVADAAVAAALSFGWDTRVGAVYLLLGLPLLAIAYARLDGIAVTFASWAFALARRRRDGAAGAALGLAILFGLWVAFLAPWALLRRRRPLLLGAAAVLAAGGAAWYLVGGVHGPMQVLSYRGATGWDVQSSTGAVLWAAAGRTVFVEGGIARVGFAPAVSRTTLLALAAAVAIWAWVRWSRGSDPNPLGGDAPGDDPAGPALTVTAALLVLGPTFPPAWVLWLVPWAAIRFDAERSRATLAALAIVLTGVLGAIVGSDPQAELPAVVVQLLAIARALALIGVVVAGLLPRRAPAPAATRV